MGGPLDGPLTTSKFATVLDHFGLHGPVGPVGPVWTCWTFCDVDGP